MTARDGRECGCIAADRDLGAAGGRRLGAELAAAELVLFLDDDAELMPGALAHLVAHLDEHPSAGAVTATVSVRHRTAQCSIAAAGWR